MENVTKLKIHIRNPKPNVDAHAHKKVKAHLHSHTHDTHRKRLHLKKKILVHRHSHTHDHARKEAIRKATYRVLHLPIREENKEYDLTIERPPIPPVHPIPEVPRKQPASVEEVTVPKPPVERQKEVAPSRPRAEAMVPAKLVIPKKPMILADIPVSSLAIAYFCMEVALESDIPTYSGGLGILAGDMLMSAADLKIDMVGVTLMYREGYFTQRFDDSGWQMEERAQWDPRAKLILLPHEVSVTLEGREVCVRAWLYKITGNGGHVNPVILLDTDVAGNSDQDKAITARLYSGDRRMRLLQEAVLGIAGVRMLQKIGATNVQKFHMNEGHSALLTLELYRQYAACDDPEGEVRRRCVFTTHTPVSAGHDRFDRGLAEYTLGEDYVPAHLKERTYQGGELNMTKLGLGFSQYVNGVAKKHGETTRELFPGYVIDSITNGVHPRRWVAPEMATIFDAYLPGWRTDPANLRYALSVPPDALWRAHEFAKERLIAHVRNMTGIRLEMDVLTIGFARRATGYKRATMLFRDIERLKSIAARSKGIQIVFAGKAHPDDRDGKLMIQEIIWRARELAGTKVTVVYIPDYDLSLAQVIIPGVDLWLNTPVRPMEASGTSGMKAALNGVPHFSTLDGWWLEGHVEGITGWAIGPHPEEARTGDPDTEDVDDLYKKLEYVIIPKYEHDRHGWVKMMRSAIAINGSFFNTQRMAEQYVLSAYFK